MTCTLCSLQALRAEIAANELEALQLAAQQQHLKRQAAGLQERIARLDHQVGRGIGHRARLSRSV